jgi:hypothetical protein
MYTFVYTDFLIFGTHIKYLPSASLLASVDSSWIISVYLFWKKKLPTPYKQVHILR